MKPFRITYHQNPDRIEIEEDEPRQIQYPSTFAICSGIHGFAMGEEQIPQVIGMIKEIVIKENEDIIREYQRKLEKSNRFFDQIEKCQSTREVKEFLAKRNTEYETGRPFDI